MSTATLPAMHEDSRAADVGSLLRIVWRRRWIVLTTFLLFTVAAAVISKSLPKEYETSSRLLVAQPAEQQSFDAVQAAQVTARTYADILGSTNIARLVADSIGGVDAQEIEDRTDFEPIPETQLLKITATGRSPEQAKEIADTYADVFQRYATQRLTERTGTVVSVADAAPLRNSAARPRPTLNTIFAALLGTLLGLGLAMVRERFDTRIEDVPSLERDFGVVPLARVPRRGRSPQSKAAFAEAFRMLRVALSLPREGETAPRTVLFTSTSEGEGKTTATRHLALALAETGQRVIIVEADVYRPQLRAALGRPARAEQGLTTYLSGQASLDQVIETTGAPNVYLVPSGPAMLSLTALLETRRGRDFLDELARAADYVIVDCPPLAPRADAAVLASRVDATVLVVDMAITTRPALREALRMLRSVGGTVIGCLVNRDTEAGASYYAYLPHGKDEPAPQVTATTSS